MSKLCFAAIAVVLAAMLSTSSASAGDTWLFTYPLDDYYTLYCNFQCHVEGNRPGGSDYTCPEGTAVIAAEDGTVSVGWDPDGYGNYITIGHSYGYQTLYGHLSAVYVQNGQFIAQGSVIGVSGHTGYVIGNPGDHLHFEVRQNGTPVDPYNGNHWLWTNSPPQLYSELSYAGTYVGKSHSSTLVFTPGSTVNCWIDFRCTPPFYWSSSTSSSHYVALHSVASNWTDMEDSPVITGTSIVCLTMMVALQIRMGWLDSVLPSQHRARQERICCAQEYIVHIRPASSPVQGLT